MRTAYIPGSPFGRTDPAVSISKAANGYLVTLMPAGDPDLDFMPVGVGESIEPHRLAEVREAANSEMAQGVNQVSHEVR